MTDFHALPPEVATEFAKLSQTATFPMDEEHGKAFFDALPVRPSGDEEKWNFIRIAGSRNAMLSALVKDEGIPEVTCDLSDGVGDPTPENVARLGVVFDEAVSRVTEVLGKPSKKVRGKYPRCAWLLPQGGQVTVSRDSFVTIELQSPTTVELDSITF